MARFNYQARDGGGDLTSGMVMAASVEEAAGKLRADGKYIIRISPSGDVEQEAFAASRTRGTKRREVIFFAHQLAVMIETGVPLTDALESAMEQTADAHFQAVLREVSNHVKGGGEFSAALEKFPKVFPPAMTSLVHAGEASGTMPLMLNRLANYLGKEDAILRQARGALLYPLFMLVMTVAVTIFLLAFVLPKFAGIYESRQATLPAPTRLLLVLSRGLVQWWHIWVTLAVGLGIVAALLNRAHAGRRLFDWLKLNAPIARTLFGQLYIARACRTMGTLIGAGVTMLDMIGIIKQVTNNVYYDQLWDNVDERLRQGAQLSEPLFHSDLFPRSIVQMIYAGEKSGQLGKVFARVADFTEGEFDQAVKTTTQFIEPLMVCVMGSMIGFVAISLLLPIFSVGTVVASG